MSYVALDRAIWTSTVLKEGPVVVATWLLLLADADRFGETRATPASIASVLRITDEEVEGAFDVLSSPDPRSRNEEFEGRRMIPLDHGNWQLVSFKQYKELATRQATLEKQRRYDQKKADERANPLVAGRRPEMESAVLAMVSEISGLEDKDPIEVMAEASDFEGSTRTKLNPAAMSDDRLANTYRDLKHNLDEARKKAKHGKA